MINLQDIQGYSALSLLEAYKGINPYLKKMRNDHLQNKSVRLTDTQVKYIVDNHQKEPILINRVVAITKFFGEELQKQENLKFLPEKILIEYILADSDKTFHIYGKIKRNQVESKMYWLPKTQVLDDPYFEVINVDVDFTKYNKILTKQGKKLYEHQESGIKFLMSRNGCILADDMGLGKAQAMDSNVLTPNGYIKMGDLCIGNYTIGSDGKPTKIIGVFPQGEKNFYNITLTDGTVVESCDEHLWAVQTTNHKKRGGGFKVKQLKDLIGDLTYGSRGNVKWYIPMVKPVEFTAKSVSLDPYVLGVLLGDGSISQHTVNFTNIDEQLINEFASRLPDEHILHNNKLNYRIISENGENSVIKYLKECFLMGTNSETKFIPKQYIYNSYKVRLEVLQGLLDTDGYCSKSDGTIQYYSVSKKLSDNVIELVQSFGGVARQTSKIGRYKLPNGIVKNCKVCYILTINLPQGIVPFKLRRKTNNLKIVKKYSPSRGIKSIEFSRKTMAQCIMVEADDHLYVMDKYTVTHNTTQAVVAALECGAKNILVVCPSSVKINWKREIKMFCNDVTIIDGKIWDKAKFTIINYDILKNFHTLGNGKKKKPSDVAVVLNRQLANAKYDLLIIDEAHNLKNNKSIRGEIMADLSVNFGIEKVWLLTGTPIANRPMDFFNLLKIIKAPIAKNWVYFTTRYCEGRKFFRTLKNGAKRQIWLTDGASNLDELASKTKNLMLRRLKTDVLDMPEKVITPFYHQLDKKAWARYDQLWDNYIEKRKEEKKKGPIQRDLVELILLRKFIALEAIPETIEMVENALESGRKCIIFTSFTDELNELADHFGKICVTHNGPMTARAKQNSVDAFQNNPAIKIFIGNVRSAGVGITLTEGTYVIFNSFDWVSGNNEQAEDRAYRIGQENDVNIVYQLFEDTVSTRMWETVRAKKDVIATIMGDNKLSDEEMITLRTEELMNEIDD